jgi:hypothetical protein
MRDNHNPVRVRFLQNANLKRLSQRTFERIDELILRTVLPPETNVFIKKVTSVILEEYKDENQQYIKNHASTTSEVRIQLQRFLTKNNSQEFFVALPGTVSEMWDCKYPVLVIGGHSVVPLFDLLCDVDEIDRFGIANHDLSTIFVADQYDEHPTMENSFNNKVRFDIVALQQK